MANKVKYGLKNVYYAVATLGADNSATYATPKAIPGAVEMSLDAEGEVTKFRADNIDYWVGQSNNGYSGSLTFALIPDDFKKDVLGYIEDTNGVLVEDADAAGAPFALLFQFEGDANATRHVLYNCSASRPGVNGQTTDTTIEPNTEELNITASSIFNDDIDKNIVKAKCNEGDAQYATWNSAVYQPV